MSPDVWGGDAAAEAAWWEATERNLGHLTTTPPLTLRDIALSVCMAKDLDELNQSVQAAVNVLGEDALDMHCVDPHGSAVMSLGSLLAREAARVTR
jgi:hypothetical protein